MDGMPRKIWKKLQDQASGTLNDEFWDDITALMPPRAPRVDMLNLDGEIVVHAELPGLLRTEDVRVAAASRTLRISGTLPCGYNSEEEERLVVNERFCGEFKRVLSLPAEIEPGATKASLSDGVLTVRMPKRPEEEATTVSVETGAHAAGKEEAGHAKRE